VISVPDGEGLPKGIVVNYDRMVERLVAMKVDKVLMIIGGVRKNNHAFW